MVRVMLIRGFVFMSNDCSPSVQYIHLLCHTKEYTLYSPCFINSSDIHPLFRIIIYFFSRYNAFIMYLTCSQLDSAMNVGLLCHEHLTT